jgi:hypothetical protein
MPLVRVISVAELDNTCIKVYDPHEPDPSKKQIAVFENHKKAGNALGVYPPMVHKSCSVKSRFFSPILKKEVTCRLSKRDPSLSKCKSDTTKGGLSTQSS